MEQLEIQPCQSIDTTNTTADTYALTEDMIPTHGSSVRKVIVNVTGTSHTLGNITRVTLRAGQTPFIDADPLHLAAYINYYSKSGAEWPTTATRWSIPLGWMGGAAPRGKRLRVEHTKNATPQTGTANFHLGLDAEAPALGYHMFITEQSNVPASSTLKAYPISQEGWLVGITFPTANVTAIQIWDGRNLLVEINALAAIIESQNLERGVAIATTTLYYRLPKPIKVVDGATKLRISTGGSWAATDVIGIHTFVYYPEVEAELLKPQAA